MDLLKYNPEFYYEDEKKRLRYKMNEFRLERMNIPKRYWDMVINTDSDQIIKSNLQNFETLYANGSGFLIISDDIDVVNSLLVRICTHAGSFINVKAHYASVAAITDWVKNDEKNLDSLCKIGALCVTGIGYDIFNDFNNSMIIFDKIVYYRFNNKLPIYLGSDLTWKELNNYFPPATMRMLRTMCPELHVGRV